LHTLDTQIHAVRLQLVRVGVLDERRCRGQRRAKLFA
jgi:hypothetical protein